MLSRKVKQKLSELLAKAWRSKKVEKRLKGKSKILEEEKKCKQE